MKQRIAMLGLFAISAAVSFCTVLPRRAQAVVRTVSGLSCYTPTSNTNGTKNWECPLLGGSDVAALPIAGAYFDYSTSPSTVNVGLYLEKISYDGVAGWTDSVDIDETPGNHDRQLTASLVNHSLSQWDYFHAILLDVNEVIGVAMYN